MLIERLMAMFKAGHVADSRGRLSSGYRAHRASRGHFKCNQRRERGVSRRRKMKSSAR